MINKTDNIHTALEKLAEKKTKLPSGGMSRQGLPPIKLDKPPKMEPLASPQRKDQIARATALYHDKKGYHSDLKQQSIPLKTNRRGGLDMNFYEEK